MIIQIRGTGGSGKSTLVRRIRDHYESSTPTFIEGRKRPISYLAKSCRVPRALFIPGSYETPTGGCDTIKTPDEVYALVDAAATEGHDVLYEGIMIGDDVTRCAALHRKFPGQVLVVWLDTPIEECLAGIQSRRDERGDDRELNPKNTVSRANRLRTSMVPRLKDAGVEVVKCTRETGYELVKQRLGLA